MKIDASWYEPQPGLVTEISAGGVVIRRADGQDWVAAVQEGPEKFAVLPKGQVEPGELLEETAYREIAEEAGLTDLILLDKLAVKERLSYPKTAWKVTHYFLFTTTQVSGTPTDPDFDYTLLWLPLDPIPALFWPDQVDVVRLARDRYTLMPPSPSPRSPQH